MRTKNKSRKMVLSVLIILCTLMTVFTAAVMAEPVLTLSSDTYVQGEPFTLTYTGIASGTDWFGIYPAGATPGGAAALWWANTIYYGIPDDVCDFRSGFNPANQDVSIAELNLAPGEYEVILCLDNGYDVAGRVSFTVTDPNAVTSTPSSNPTTSESGLPVMLAVIALLSIAAIISVRRRSTVN
ncbi:MAG: hypothetical protein ACYCYM_14635 [Saccharofermentanales bacterium]